MLTLPTVTVTTKNSQFGYERKIKISTNQLINTDVKYHYNVKKCYPLIGKKGEMMGKHGFFELSAEKSIGYQLAKNYQILPYFFLTETKKSSILLIVKGEI